MRKEWRTLHRWNNLDFYCSLVSWSDFQQNAREGILGASKPQNSPSDRRDWKHLRIYSLSHLPCSLLHLARNTHKKVVVNLLVTFGDVITRIRPVCSLLILSPRRCGTSPPNCCPQESSASLSWGAQMNNSKSEAWKTYRRTDQCIILCSSISLESYTEKTIVQFPHKKSSTNFESDSLSRHLLFALLSHCLNRRSSFHH